MKILVTGGAGFIGSQIVDLLIKKDYEVVIIDNLSTGKKDYINDKAKFYEADITKEIDLIFKKEKPEIVIHMAAQVMLRDSLENPIYDAKTNIFGTINVLESCRKHNVKKIIYTSTIAVIGEPEYLPVDEKHLGKPCSPYGISKYTAEHYVRAYNQLCGLDYLILRFGNVYGPRDDIKYKRVISLFIDCILKNKIPSIFGDGNQTRDFIYVCDLAEFIAENINKNPKNKLFHLAYGEQISVNEIFNIVKELCNLKENAKYVQAVKGEVKDIYLDISLAKTELNWNSKYNIKQGLKKTLEYVQENLTKT